MDNKDLINALESAPQKGRDMLIIGKDNLSPEVLEWAVKNNKKIAVDKLDSTKAKEYGFKFPLEVRRTISASEINHTLQRHGEGSNLVKKSGQKPVTMDDIQKWVDYSDEASEKVFTKDDLGQDVVVSGKQINGYYVIVESIRKKHNELGFKTMYFEKGNLKDNEMFKNKP